MLILIFYLNKGKLNMKTIGVYPTRIEISPYKEGDYPDVERLCSTEYYSNLHRRLPIGYRIVDNVLYIPRGINIQYLVNKTGSVPTMYKGDKFLPMKKEYKITSPPRNENQKEAIQFLLGEGEHEKTKRYAQLALIVQPGFGKTYCATASMIGLKRKTIIILHRDTIREQWLSTFRERTTIDMKRVCEIQGSELMKDLSEPKNIMKYDIYLVLHQTIGSYQRTYGADGLREWFDKMGFGLKIVDEVHYCFQQTIETDFCSNVDKNFYLTATFTRSDPKEVNIFKRVFGNTMRFGEDLDLNKNVIYNIVYYNSNPSSVEQAGIKTYQGVSSARFADYAFERDPYATIYSVFFRVLKVALSHEGKIIIVIPKIDYCERIASLIQKEYPHVRVGTMHSKNTKKHNASVKEHAEIIVSTIASLGTGADIEKIRTLIIMEPYSSKVTAKQLSGRLRPYGNNEDSFVYEIVDSGFGSIVSMINRRSGYLKKICKEVKAYNT